MTHGPLIQRIQEFAQKNGLTWRRNRNKIGIAFHDGLDEQRLELDHLSPGSLEEFLERFAALAKIRQFILEEISKAILSRGGSVERKPSGWMITTPQGVGINAEFDWRFTRELTRKDPGSILRQFLKDYRQDAMPARTPRETADLLAEGFSQAFSHIQALAEGVPNHRQEPVEYSEKNAFQMDAIARSMEAFVQEMVDLVPDRHTDPDGPVKASLLLMDYEPRHEARLVIRPLDAGFDLERCDAWARGIIEEMRRSPSRDWYRNPYLWIPEMDTWMTDAHWEAWAETELGRNPSPWSTVTASILLKPGGKTLHRDSARRWAERWLKEYAHDADCYEEILLPFIREIDGLEEALDVSTWDSMVRAWNAGDTRWEKSLRDAAFGHDHMYLDSLIHPGMRRSFWEDLFSPDELDRIRHHLLDWSRREPVWELRYGFPKFIHLSVVMGWKEVLESVANRPFLSHHLGSLDTPIAALKENSRRLLESFQAHLDSLPGRDRADDHLAIGRLKSQLETAYAHTEIPDALVCTAAEEFRPWTLPLFARAISRFGDRHAPETVLTDSWALAVGWSRLRPLETLEGNSE